MKTIFITVLFFLLGFSSFGQKIHFTDTGNVWNMYFVSNNVIPQYGISFSYSYKGDSLYHNTRYKIMVNTNNKLVAYVREDEAAKKVFVRTPTLSDTETVLYDYNLIVEDTFVYGNRVFQVTSMDTVLIDTISYKTWVLQHDSASYVEQHYFIEGLGCIEGPLASVLTPDTTGHVFLKCFNHDSTTPTLSHVVGLYFDNATSCNSTFGVGVGVSNVTGSGNVASLYPNPIDETSKIVLPYNIVSGKLIISNEIGQTITNTNFKDKNEVFISDRLYAPGIYFYHVTDNQSGVVFSGKFMSR